MGSGVIFHRSKCDASVLCRFATILRQAGVLSGLSVVSSPSLDQDKQMYIVGSAGGFGDDAGEVEIGTPN